MKPALFGGVLWSVSAFASVTPALEILDRTEAPVESHRLVHVQCEIKNRHLELEIATEQGVLQFRGKDFASLSHNPRFSWKLTEGSASKVAYSDRLGFRWTPRSGEVTGVCAVQLVRSPEGRLVSLQCGNLTSGEMPGLLSLRVRSVSLPCGN